MFNNPYNYFLAIWFDWSDVYEMMSLPKEVTEGMKLSDRFSTISILNGSTEVGIDSESGLFEFYIIPNSLRNGDYKPYSTIYDQQLKQFSSEGKIIYGKVLENKEKNDYIYCGFYFRSDLPNKACFSISNVLTEKQIKIYFDSDHLNELSVNKKWGDQINIEATLTETSNSISEPLEKTVILKDGVFTVTKHIQSQYE